LLFTMFKKNLRAKTENQLFLLFSRSQLI
jgi:hypothetical protein